MNDFDWHVNWVCKREKQPRGNEKRAKFSRISGQVT